MRLDRFLSHSTGLSRSRAKGLIIREQVRIDGVVARDPALTVSADQSIQLDGQELSWPRSYYVMLHKPLGVVCSTTDPVHTPVHQLVDKPFAKDLHAAGRLDADSTGLVLLTSDGAWSHRLTSPRRHCDKSYLVTLERPLEPALIARFAAGITLNDDPTPTLPAQLEPLGEYQARVVLREGRYHQVRRMFAACGNHVSALHRERIGPLMLDPALAPGQWRELSAAEVDALRHA
jgi:16S rRNA pseudouridine516 synthase